MTTAVTPHHAAQRAEALLRLERTRLQWALRSAEHAQGAGDDAGEVATPDTLNGVLTGWLADEISARLWPDPANGPHPESDGSAQDNEAGQPAPLPSQLLSQAVSDWTSRHPWLSVLAGLLAGSLVMSQRKRLLRWGVSAALPWLASNAGVLALPLLTHWLTHQPSRSVAASPGQEDPQADPPPPSADEPPPPEGGEIRERPSAPGSADAGPSG